jgi:acetylornithine/succinyldiaminopimelate/putrescine aminotransferase/predicted amino acid dehydrogenase
MPLLDASFCRRGGGLMMHTNSALNPELARLLQYCNMDRSWRRGQGAWLYDDTGRRFLDCYAQYGAVVLGHNPPGPVAALRAALDDCQPAMVQPYRAPHAVTLAERLVALAPPGLARCVFTTSGAETVEAAIKLVRIATGRTLIVSCDGSFHGKTMGARAASGRVDGDDRFGPTPQGFSRVPFGDAAALAATLETNAGKVAAVMVEPVQGERGVFLPPTGYLPSVRALCDRAGAALILDEIQTGLGRTGRLFACEHEGVVPDVLLLAKGLGGGLLPLGACLATEAIWHPGFALAHSSTFANNNLACRIGLAVLDELTDGKACERAAAAGQYLQVGLHALARRFPSSIAEVRGMGLLTAIELRPAAPEDGFTRSYLSHNGLYGYAVASTLAERHAVLVLPALSGTNVLRVAPNLLISDAELDFALAGFGGVFAALEAGATDIIARALWRLDQHGDVAPATTTTSPRAPSARLYLPRYPRPRVSDASTYAFLMHPTRQADLLTGDPSLRRLSPAALDRFTTTIGHLPPGVVFEAPKVTSATGATACGWLIGLGLLPEEMARRGRAAVAEQIIEAGHLAQALGARVLGLGALTTTFSRRGLDLIDTCPVVTTGSCLTAAMAVAAIERIVERRRMSLHHATIGVVGARGSVGELATQLLARARPKRMLLIGNSASGRGQMRALCAKLAPFHVGAVIETTDLSRLAECDIVLSATSSGRPVLEEAVFRQGTIVCDVARPPDASDAMRARRDLTVIDGGLVALPDPTMRFGPGNLLGFPDGQQLACLSETILLALADETQDIGIGDNVPLDQVDRVVALARHHGFSLAEPPVDALDAPLGLAAATAAE